jgi:hypothetical protein
MSYPVYDDIRELFKIHDIPHLLKEVVQRQVRPAVDFVLRTTYGYRPTWDEVRSLPTVVSTSGRGVYTILVQLTQADALARVGWTQPSGHADGLYAGMSTVDGGIEG